MPQLLKRYRINTTKRGSQLVAACPLCKQETFKVSVEKNAFKCFSKDCQHKKFQGNILDFVKFLERTDTIKEAAYLIYSWYCVPVHATRHRKKVCCRSSATFGRNCPCPRFRGLFQAVRLLRILSPLGGFAASRSKREGNIYPMDLTVIGIY
jgi:hypothetical protein